MKIAAYANDDKEDWPSYMEHTASVVDHELDHEQRAKDIYDKIETEWNAWYNGLNFFEKIAMSVGDATDQVEIIHDSIDDDRDSVDDSIDPNIGVDDDEDFAEAAETGTGCDTSEDWSRYGENWFE